MTGRAMALVRRIGWTRPVRAVVTRPRVERAIAVVLEASTVSPSVAFVVRELSRRGQHAWYRVRESGRPVCIRHNTADPSVLDEVFYSRHYELPAQVRAYLDGLGRAPRVVDLGANIGLFGVWLLARYPAAELVAYEPDATNADVLRRCVAANSAPGGWECVQAAASNHDGAVPFVAGEYSRSRIEERRDAVLVEARDVLPLLATVDFAKIDIEGGEWVLLGDPRFSGLPTPVIVLEYHPDGCPFPDARQAARAALHGAGYATVGIREFDVGRGMLWAWKRDLAQTEAASAAS